MEDRSEATRLVMEEMAQALVKAVGDHSQCPHCGFAVTLNSSIKNQCLAAYKK